ncbi:MAG: HD domain-containing phosphohydrolase [Gammaproteobacteria bacterium]|jgi:HD-GYP domain-containing protein (c-di-GMP phosphodiesterase class II)
MADLNIKISMDDEIIADFRENFNDQYDVTANCISQLEKDPSDKDAIHAMFRALHTIKGNSNLCQLNILTQFSHAVEEIAVAMRQGEIQYKPILGELILLCLDKIKEVSEDLFQSREVNTDVLNQAEEILNSMSTHPQLAVTSKAAKVISLIASNTIKTHGLDVYGIDSVVPAETQSDNIQDIAAPSDKAKQLDYFEQLAMLLESKFPYWEGRIQRTLPLALELNRQMNNAEDPVQMKTAVLMHDISLAFLNERLWQKETKFSAQEIEQMQMHPALSANMLELIPGWEDAQNIVLQHHERWDGNGYPGKLKGDKICIGAQIMAVVDAFESMTHARPDRQYKRSILRAMTEINNCSGTQFSPHVTSLFNTVIRDTLTHQKASTQKVK